jgi:hypothetical protein
LWNTTNCHLLSTWHSGATGAADATATESRGGGGGGAAAGEANAAAAAPMETYDVRRAKLQPTLIRHVISSPVDGTVAAVASRASKLQLFAATDAGLEPIASQLDCECEVTSIAFTGDGRLWVLTTDLTHPLLVLQPAAAGTFAKADSVGACLPALQEARETQTELGLLKLEGLVKLTENTNPDIYWDRKKQRIIEEDEKKIKREEVAAAIAAGGEAAKPHLEVGHWKDRAATAAAAALAAGDTPKQPKVNRNKRKKNLQGAQEEGESK